MKTSTQLLAAAALTLSAQLGMAQSSAPAPTSAAKKELIAKLLVLQQPGLEGLSRGIIQGPLSQLMQGAGAELQKLPAEKREATAKAMEADIKKFAEDNAPILRDSAFKIAPGTVGAILDERFTEEELRQIATWFESPVSKKFAQASGEMQKALTDKILAENGPALESRFKLLQQSLAKHLGLPTQPAGGAKPAAAPASSPAKPAVKK